MIWRKKPFENIVGRKENTGNYHFLPIRQTSVDSVPTSNLLCIKMASILNSQSRDLKYGGTLTNHCKVIILSMKSLARLKDQVESLVYKMFIMNEIDFHRLFNGIMNVVLSFFKWSLTQ